LLAAGGCSSRPAAGNGERRHPGPKISIPDFIERTAAYKGKTIYLTLTVDEGDRARRSLREYAGRDVAFTTQGPHGERLDLVITLPGDLALPDVPPSEEVSVKFVCTRGSLRAGNEAKAVEKL
jgi:hypothetical protein